MNFIRLVILKTIYDCIIEHSDLAQRYLKMEINDSNYSRLKNYILLDLHHNIFAALRKQFGDDIILKYTLRLDIGPEEILDIENPNNEDITELQMFLSKYLSKHYLEDYINETTSHIIKNLIKSNTIIL